MAVAEYLVANRKDAGMPGPQGPSGPAGVTSARGETLPPGSEVEVSLENRVLTVKVPRGDKGDTGDAATVTIGEVTTGEPGSGAAVTNSGDEHHAVWDITLPRGDRGPKGDTATVKVGSVTTGEPGSQASVTNSGTDTDAVWDITIPRGDKGDAATVHVGKVATGEPGTEAVVGNSGDEHAAILDFTIPKGQKGDKGDGLQIDYTAASSGELPTSGVTEGQTGIVNGELFVWDGSQWVSQGQMQGAKGDDGAPGQSATVSVGRVTTGEPGTDAVVSNSGTTSAAVLDFTIPRGEDGAPGAKGDPGEPGHDGQDGAPGKDGVTPDITLSASVDAAVGTPSVQVSKGGALETPSFALAFHNIKGDPGADGTDGIDGEDAVVATIPVTFEASLFASGVTARKSVAGLGSVNMISPAADAANVAVIQAAGPVLAQDHGDDSSIPEGMVQLTVATAPTADMDFVITVLRSES